VSPRMSRKPLLALLICAGWAAPVAAAPARQAPARADATTVRVVQTTADLSHRLTRLADRRFGRRKAARGVAVITVDERRRYQRIEGFGAAITDTAAWLLRQLPPAARIAAMRRRFGARGIRLGFVRLPMGGSDFTKDGVPYTYDDLPPGQSDPSLSQFSVAHDDAYVVPTLREMRSIDARVRILASPWSPPDG
jgi:glucosylceramidase